MTAPDAAALAADDAPAVAMLDAGGNELARFGAAPSARAAG
jgi:hypothetical protein